MDYGLYQERNYIVSKANEFIQRNRYSLSLQQQKIILYMVSKIKPGMEELERYDFDLRDLCDICGIQKHGENYENFKESIRKLSDKSFWVETERVDYLCRWITEVEIYKQETRVRIRFDSRLKKYLLDLRDNFTSYELEKVLPMKSGYAVRLYEIFKSYAYRGVYIDTVEHIKALLCIEENYERFSNLKTKVIMPALNEINKYTDLEIEYEPIRTSHQITSIKFTIKKKDCYEEAKAMLERGIVLNRIENDRNQQRLEGFEDEPNE